MKTAKYIELLTYCEAKRRGWEPAVVEVKCRYITYDLLGIIDVLALEQDHGFIGIQATDATHRWQRLKKIEASPWLGRWTEAGGTIYLWAWHPPDLAVGLDRLLLTEMVWDSDGRHGWQDFPLRRPTAAELDVVAAHKRRKGGRR